MTSIKESSFLQPAAEDKVHTLAAETKELDTTHIIACQAMLPSNSRGRVTGWHSFFPRPASRSVQSEGRCFGGRMNQG